MASQTTDRSIDAHIDNIFDRLDQRDLQTDRIGTLIPTGALKRREITKPMRKILPENEYPSFLR